ncbi:MAG: family 20 glycosylhydrolase [Vicingaceae bacterium]
MQLMKWSGSFWLLVVSFWFLVGCDFKKEATPEIANYNIIPQPKNLDTLSGFFQIDIETSINGDEHFHKFLENYTNLEFYLDNPKPGKGIFIGYKSDNGGPETYTLEVTKYRIDIKAKTPEGISRGIATLKQLIFLNSDSSRYFVPCVKIKDAPKFKHRGLLLDCSRHFFEKEVVKKYIDLLAFYKMNVLHWHLTEDQGWRIAIDKYPKLTEIGAWRTELDGSKYGGFYSKADIREIVAYAQERHVTIIPEIELPGHSQAAIAAYPHLSCTGKQVDVANDWGVFKEIYCAGNDSVFIFLEDVLTEVMELFPSEYIHIGGDEAPKFRWEHCSKCQKRIKDNKLKDEHGLQSYFISRIEKFLNKNGRQLIGWDEILEGGLSPNATVQSWRGMEGGITAANSGHDAIMSPTSHAYFDYDLKAIDLEKVYNFDPIPEELAAEKHHFIIGGECNMWTEHVPDEANLDSKVFPRLLAMSEVLWSYPEERNYEAFYNRVQNHYPILKNLGVNYGFENISATITSYINKDGIVRIIPKAGNKDLTLKYQWKYGWYNEQKLKEILTQDYKTFENEIKLDQSGKLYVQAYKNDEAYGEPTTQHFENHNAIGKKVLYKSKYNQWYSAGGDSGLVDSKTGSLDFRDGNWQGFYGNDAEMIVDLGELDLSNESQTISEVSINFYQYNNSWIFFPSKVEFSISRDGNNYVNVPTLANENISPKERGKHIETFRTGFERQHIKYIKVKAKSIGKVPDWHEAAGSDSWLFMDEIIVK